MKHLRWLFLLAAGLGLACVNVRGPEKVDVRLGGGGRHGPSQLPSRGGGWRDLLSGGAGQVVGAENGFLYFAYDTLAYPRRPVDLVARLQVADGLKPVRGATIGFYWKRRMIGSAQTDGDGLASISWSPPDAGIYRFTAKVTHVKRRTHDEALLTHPAPLRVIARPREYPFVVIDLDYTLVDSSFVRVLLWDGGKPMADSVPVTQRIARQYGVIYLTDRPDLLTRKSKSWLTGHGYPDGAVMLSEPGEAFGDSGKFKTGRLLAVRRAFPNAAIGIGDKPSDAEAYVKNGLTAYLIPHYKRKPKDMRKMAKTLRSLRGRTRGRLQVVAGWREIDAGIRRGLRYPARTFATWLDREADRLDAEKKARKREKDDDDDDD